MILYFKINYTDIFGEKMKKKSIVYVAISIIIIVAVIFLVTNNFTGNVNNLSGTIGKVEKYRKVQLTEQDIKLRNDLLTDTSAVSKSIKGLLIFNSFSLKLKDGINNWTNELKSNTSKEFEPTIAILKDYSKFIDDNSKTVEDALLFLLDVYNGDTTEASVNMTAKIKKFDSFVEQLIKKDSMLAKVIPGFDKEIKARTKANDSKEAIQTLVNIKEQFAINAMPLALLSGYRGLIDLMNNTVISNTANFKSSVLSSMLNSKVLVGSKTLGTIAFEGIQLEAIRAGSTGSLKSSLNSITSINSAVNNVGSKSALSGLEICSMQSLGIIYIHNFSNSLGCGSSAKLGFRDVSSLINSSLNNVVKAKLNSKLGMVN